MVNPIDNPKPGMTRRLDMLKMKVGAGMGDYLAL
jgi:hypothetical protein